MMQRFKPRFIETLTLTCILLVSTNPASAQDLHPNVKIKTQNGTVITAVLVEIETDNTVVSGSQPATLPNESIASIQFPQSVKESVSPFTIRLVDGSTIHVSSFELTNQLLVLGLGPATSIQVKTRNVQSIRLSKHSDDLESQWNDLSSTPPNSGDGLIVKRSDRLEMIEGVVGNIDQERIEFTLNDQQARIKRSKVDGIVFYHAVGRELVEPTCKLNLGNSSTLTLRSAVLDGNEINCTLVCGTRFKIPSSLVSSFDFASGRSVFLSEIKPTSQDWEPLIASSAIVGQLKSMRLPKVNSSFDNSPLSLTYFPEKGVSFLSETRQFEHGFAMVGGSKLVFNLGGEYQSLTGQVGFAPRSSNDGNAKFVVIADGKRILEQTMKKSDALDPIELNLKMDDVQRLVFMVEYNDGRAVGDLLHLCDLKVSK